MNNGNGNDERHPSFKGKPRDKGTQFHGSGVAGSKMMLKGFAHMSIGVGMLQCNEDVDMTTFVVITSNSNIGNMFWISTRGNLCKRKEELILPRATFL